MSKIRILGSLLAGTLLSTVMVQPTTAQPPGFSPWSGGGGPPMMGGGMMSGGPPQWGGGGDRSSRGGERGGDRSGGFDPSSFLTRMDSNGNGMLDPEEAQGPARFMLDRMARDNPKIDVTKPIPMSTLTEAFQRMRSGESPWRSSDSSSDEFVLSPEKTSLVPGFGAAKVERAKVPGFGVGAEEPTVQIEEQDLRDADERIKRYDKNNDEVLDENEIKEGRWSDSPMAYDRNRDGKLTKQELAVRQAKRRLASSSSSSSDSSRRDSSSPQNASSSTKRRDKDKGDSGDDKKDKGNPFDKISSYRLGDKDGKALKPAGLPEWFTRNDANSDNQVSMSEVSRKWSEDTVKEFGLFDTNQDGYITTKECLAGVKKGHIPNFAGGGSSSSSASSGPSPATTSVASKMSGATSAATPSSSGTIAASPSAGSDDRMRSWAEGKMKKIDKDNNKLLSPDEFTEGDFAAVDTNKDGTIDLNEYVVFRNKR